jgi:hypothetical protein
MSAGTITPLRQRMIEDMNARKLCAGTQRGHIQSCKRFAGFLKRSPDTATAEDIRRFQLHLSETGTSICNRNRIMTGLRFLFRVTLRRLDLAAEIYHIREPLVTKQFDLVRELARERLVIGLLVNPNFPDTEGLMNDAQTAAAALGQKLVVVKASTESDLDLAFTTLVQQPPPSRAAR